LTYLNSCSHGALSSDVREAYLEYLRDWEELGSPWELWGERTEQARGAFAELVGADAQDVAVTASLSAGVSALASGLRFDEPRSKVVLSEVEFPTVGQIWHAQEERGARVVHTRDFESEIDEQTLLVSLTHVSYRTGERLPIEEITRFAHERGALVFLDAYQSAGTIPLDVRALDVDFLAAGTVKYLLGSAGLAFFYARRSLVESIRPLRPGGSRMRTSLRWTIATTRRHRPRRGSRRARRPSRTSMRGSPVFAWCSRRAWSARTRASVT